MKLVRAGAAGVAAMLLSSFLAVAWAGATTRAPYDMPVSTFAGGLGAGPATNLGVLPNAIGIVGDTLYIAEQSAFRAVDLSTGISRVVATNPWNIVAPVDSTVLHGACAIAPAPDGTLYIGEPGKVVHLDAQYRLTDVAVTPREHPCALAVEANGDVLMSGNGMLLYRIDPGAGTVTAIWPTMNGASFSVTNPTALATMPNGDFLIAQGDGRVMRSTPQGDVTLFAGTGAWTALGDGGPAVDAQINPTGLAVAADGSVYVAEGSRGFQFFLNEVRLSRQMVRIIQQGIYVFAFGVNGLGVLLCAWGILNPVGGALFHEFASLAVMLNSLRLLWFERWDTTSFGRVASRTART
jgi:sugar lactone lactonase YvrE